MTALPAETRSLRSVGVMGMNLFSFLVVPRVIAQPTGSSFKIIRCHLPSPVDEGFIALIGLYRESPAVFCQRSDVTGMMFLAIAVWA